MHLRSYARWICSTAESQRASSVTQLHSHNDTIRSFAPRGASPWSLYAKDDEEPCDCSAGAVPVINISICKIKLQKGNATSLQQFEPRPLEILSTLAICTKWSSFEPTYPCNTIIRNMPPSQLTMCIVRAQYWLLPLCIQPLTCVCESQRSYGHPGWLHRAFRKLVGRSYTRKWKV